MGDESTLLLHSKVPLAAPWSLTNFRTEINLPASG